MTVERWTDEMVDGLASSVTELRESVTEVRESITEVRESVTEVRDSVDGGLLFKLCYKWLLKVSEIWN